MKNVRQYLHRGPFLSTIVKDGQLTLRIRQATETGYIECESKGVFDAAYPSSLLRRARVKDDGRVAGAIMAGDTQQLLFYEIEL